MEVQSLSLSPSNSLYAACAGLEDFVDLWATHGGNLGILCTNTSKAPAALEEPKSALEDVLDSVPAIAQADEATPGEDEAGEESEGPSGPGPVAESEENSRDSRLSDHTETVIGWWDAWFDDVAFDVVDGEADEEVIDEELEDIVDMEEAVEELLFR
eukprot:scaffold95475_cov30-Prasinocladus_malaysianus.AAC.1